MSDFDYTYILFLLLLYPIIYLIRYAETKYKIDQFEEKGGAPVKYFLVSDLDKDQCRKKIEEYFRSKNPAKEKLSVHAYYDCHDDDNTFGSSLPSISFDYHGDPYQQVSQIHNYPNDWYHKIGIQLVREMHTSNYEMWKGAFDLYVKYTLLEYGLPEHEYEAMCRCIWRHKFQRVVFHPKFANNKTAERILDKRITIERYAEEIKKLQEISHLP